MRYTAAAAGLLAIALTTSPAWAAPPGNDTSAGAIAVSAGFDQTIDTTEATTDAEDAQLNAGCGFQHTDASVWYTLEGTGQDVAITTGGSNYITGVLVGVGTPGDLQLVTCSFGGVEIFAEVGTSYHILVIDPQYEETVNGGNLRVAVRAIAEPTIDLADAPLRGRISRSTGLVSLSGTFTCTNAHPTIDTSGLGGTLTQRLPNGTTVVAAVGDDIDDDTCDGSPQQWSTNEISAYPDSFRAGQATLELGAFVCGQVRCAQDQVTVDVKLSVSR